MKITESGTRVVPRKTNAVLTIQFLVCLTGSLLLTGCGDRNEADRQFDGDNSSAPENVRHAKANESSMADSSERIEATNSVTEESVFGSSQRNNNTRESEIEQNDRLHVVLIQAVAQADLEKVRESLAKGAQPDYTSGNDATPLELAARLASGRNAVPKSLDVFVELCRHIRHRSARTVEMDGELQIIAGFEENTVQITTSDGSAFPLAISSAETTFRNAQLADGKLDIRFKNVYRVGGVLARRGTIEVEQFELLKAPEAEPGTAESGWSFPVPLLLPSTKAQLLISNSR
jgi:predicted nucleotidyltransferase